MSNALLEIGYLVQSALKGQVLLPYRAQGLLLFLHQEEASVQARARFHHRIRRRCVFSFIIEEKAGVARNLKQKHSSLLPYH